jgi:WD40 repeat protein
MMNVFEPKCCLSAGYCGNIFMTDMAKYKADKLTDNGVYNAGSAVSSVLWNTGYATVASATTDAGFLHVFDTRVGQRDRRTSIVINTQFIGLYSHAWTDTNSPLLGFGDGSLRLFDIRMPQQCVVTFHDPVVSQIGSITLDPQKKFMAAFGSPGFSVWHCASAPGKHFTLWHHDPLSVSKLQLELDPFYKTDGAFMLTGGRKNGVILSTDAHVRFALLMCA